jgi:hypothetical protein
MSDVHAKYYTASGHLTAGKVTVVFEGRIIFKQYIPKKHKFLEKIHKLCDMSGCMYQWVSTQGRTGHLQL